MLCSSLDITLDNPVGDALDTMFDATQQHPDAVFFQWIATIVGPKRMLGWEGGPVTLEHDDNDGDPVWVMMHRDTGMGAYYFMDEPDGEPRMTGDYTNVPGLLSEVAPNNPREAAHHILKVLVRFWK